MDLKLCIEFRWGRKERKKGESPANPRAGKRSTIFLAFTFLAGDGKTKYLSSVSGGLKERSRHTIPYAFRIFK